ncbi:MAG: STAS domain-containing protein [Chthonomonadales bacterium]|nr:STAS domain-containing protein [Chthonomonadales bacterium]
MALKTHVIDGVTVVTVPGPNLDSGNADEFRTEVAPILAQSGKVVFDLGELEFVDSSGLGSFLTCLRQLNATGGDLKLCRMRKQVRTLFELVRMHRVFEILGTPAEAVAAFK